MSLYNRHFFGLVVSFAFVLSFCALGVFGGEESLKMPKLEWKWSDSELRKIEKLERKIKNDDKFFSWESKAYIVRTTLSKRFAAELCLYMDIFVDEFSKIFPMPPRGKVVNKLIVVVLSSKGEYVSECNAPQWSGGVFIPDWNAEGWPCFQVYTYPWNDKDKEDFTYFNRGVLQHEGGHAMLQKFTGKTMQRISGVWKDMLPIALNEGVATYFENWNLRDDHKKNIKERHTRSFHLRALKRYIKANPGYEPDLTKLIDLTHDTWAPDGGGELTSLNYGLAESFVDFMLSVKRNRSKFKKMIKRVYKRRPVLTEKEIKKLEPKWRKHIKKLMKDVRLLKTVIIVDKDGNEVGRKIIDEEEEEKTE